MPLAVARESSVKLIDDAIAGGKLIGVFTQTDPTHEEPGEADLHPIGTLTHIHKMFKLPDGSLRLIVQGLARIRLVRIASAQPYLRAEIVEAPEECGRPTRSKSTRLQRNVRANFQQIVQLSPVLSDDLTTLAAEHQRSGPGGGLHRLEPDDRRRPPPSRNCSRRSTCARASRNSTAS